MQFRAETGDIPERLRVIDSHSAETQQKAIPRIVSAGNNDEKWLNNSL